MVSEALYKEERPLLAHVIYRLDVGGLENGLVNLINGLPQGRYRHAIICIKDYTDFRFRIRHPDVQYFALNKKEGNDLSIYLKLWSLFRRLRPALVHTRNLAALEAQLPAFLAAVPCRIHSEHGRDVHDIDGTNRRYQKLRRVFQTIIHLNIALSRDLEGYLLQKVGVRQDKVLQIYNGVDTTRFALPNDGEQESAADFPFRDKGLVVIGTVGRMEPVKDQLTLTRAFVQLLESQPETRQYLRLVLVGDGSLREQARVILQQANSENLAWLPGSRGDIPEILRSLDLFVLPSLAEGVSNTILEAMASGLPVIATRVGGNSELVVEGETGLLVPAGDPSAMADAIGQYLRQQQMIAEHGASGRVRIEREFSIHSMLAKYQRVYDDILASRAGYQALADKCNERQI